MTENPTASFDERLHRVAVEFILPMGLDVTGAVSLAEDMVASGVADAGTVDAPICPGDAMVGCTGGGIPEIVTDPIPANDVSALVIS